MYKTKGMKSTDNSRVYKRELQYNFNCSFCGANTGCNRHAYKNDIRSWKKYRNTQYKKKKKKKKKKKREIIMGL